MTKIKFCKHAKLKFQILRKHNLYFTEQQIKEVVANPDKIVKSEKDRMIAQKTLNADHVIRVIFEESKDQITIITFYPARRDRYENKL